MATHRRRLTTTEWARKANKPGVDQCVSERVGHLRRLMLVHSCIYYQLDENIVTDHQWTEWAQELLEFQATFGHEFGFYDDLFEDWNGSSGHHLVYDSDVVRVARRTMSQALEFLKNYTPPRHRRRLFD